MPSVTRTKSETVVTVTATNRKIRVFAEKELTIEESRELRGLLKAEERKAEGQQPTGAWDFTFAPNTFSRYFGSGIIH